MESPPLPNLTLEYQTSSLAWNPYIMEESHAGPSSAPHVIFHTGLHEGHFGSCETNSSCELGTDLATRPSPSALYTLTSTYSSLDTNTIYLASTSTSDLKKDLPVFEERDKTPWEEPDMLRNIQTALHQKIRLVPHLFPFWWTETVDELMNWDWWTAIGKNGKYCPDVNKGHGTRDLWFPVWHITDADHWEIGSACCLQPSQPSQEYLAISFSFSSHVQESRHNKSHICERTSFFTTASFGKLHVGQP